MKLSIITINLNNASGLRKTIESVVNQTFTDFEYIIIDGGSTDGSVDLIREYQHRINYWVSEPDKGIYNAMNKGIVKAKGEYLLMLNSGDVIYNNDSLKLVLHSNISTDVIYGDVMWDTSGDNYVSTFPNQLTFDFFFHNSLAHQSTFIKKKIHDEIGLYNEGFKIISDWAFLVLCIVKCECSYTHIDMILSECSRDGVSCDLTNWNLILEEKSIFLSTCFSMYYNDYLEYYLLKKTNDELRKKIFIFSISNFKIYIISIPKKLKRFIEKITKKIIHF